MYGCDVARAQFLAAHACMYPLYILAMGYQMHKLYVVREFYHSVNAYPIMINVVCSKTMVQGGAHHTWMLIEWSHCK